MRRNKIIYVYAWAIALPLLLQLGACRKFITLPPPETQLTEELVFQEDATAIAAMAGIYNKMGQSVSWASGGGSSVTLMESVYADEMMLFVSPNSTGSLPSFYQNNVLPVDGFVSGTWGSCYNLIYSANRIIEGLQKSTGVSKQVKDQLTGEALFIRAFCHFYLANLFGDVPYITSTDYRANSTVNRTPVAEVYAGIVKDLTAAQGLLPENYVSAYRVRPTKWVASALLARVYLYTGQWQDAETQASAVIASPLFTLPANIDSVFLKESREAIWQLIPSPEGNTAFESQYFFLVSTPTNRPYFSSTFYNGFESGDKRRLQWTDTLTVGLSSWYFASKYKQRTLSPGASIAEYSVLMRLAEQYLIRAEARAKQAKLSGANSASSDINTIRLRAGLLPTTAFTQEQLLAAVEQERRSELFAEWGHRFFDLKRWSKLNQVLAAKPGWQATDALLPLPQAELLVNTNLKQNPGY